MRKENISVASVFNTEVTEKEQVALFGRALDPRAQVPRNAERTEFVPEIEAHIFHPEYLTFLLVWYFKGGQEPLYLFSQPGTGKSTSIYQFAARLNVPVYEITISDNMVIEDLTGHYVIEGGDTKGKYGVLPRAMGAGDYLPGICLVNELHKANDAVLTGMNEVLEGRALTLSINGCERIKPHPEFRFVGTGNTSLIEGDQFGQFPSAQVQDASFVDRFWKYEYPYSRPEVEKKIVQMACPWTDNTAGAALVEKTISVFNALRAQHVSVNDSPGALTTVASTRSLVRFVRMLSAFKDLPRKEPGIDVYTYCLDAALTATAPAGEREAIHEKFASALRPKAQSASAAA